MQAQVARLNIGQTLLNKQFKNQIQMKRNLLLISCLVLLTTLTNAQIPTSGLVAWYPFNGNANDESGNNNNGTVNGATLINDRFGNANSAYNFNGVSDYINIVNNILPTTQTSLTISLWFNSSDTDAHFICDRSGASNLSKYSIGTSPGYGYKVRSSGNPNCNYHLFANNNFNPSIWNHIVVTKDMTAQTTSLYLNGILVGTDNHACYTNFSSATAIGRGNSFYAPYGDGYTNGILDDIGIWNRVLTTTEIQQLYNISDVPKTCLISWYPFNGNANDLSSNSNNGTVNGATLTNDRFGNANKAYSFNGSSNSVTFASNASLEPSNKLTVSVWAKPNGMGIANFPHLLTKRYCLNSCLNGYNSYAIHYGADTGYAFVLETDSGGVEVSFGAKSYMFNQWTHLVATYDGTTINVYRNDTLVTTKSHKGNIKYNSSLPLTIGYSSVNAQYYQGSLDDIGIWCRVLTSAEIKQLNSGAILPVKITNFTLHPKEKSINLQWTVTNETNVKQYNIKRSTDSKNFETIGKTNAQKLNEYNFIDANLPNSNVVFYMLETIDNDGKLQYSQILKQNLAKTLQSLSIYPNPAYDKFIVECNDIKQIKLTNQLGQVMKEYNNVNATQKIISTQGLTKGLYIVQVFSNDNSLTQKLIIE